MAVRVKEFCMIRRWLHCAAVLPMLAVPQPAMASAGSVDVIAATYNEFSLPAPTPEKVVICHGFGCRYRAELGFTKGDHARLARLLAPGRASAAAERGAIAKAGAWFDRRIAPLAGTKGHVARAGASYMNDPGQFDCVDSSRNTTSLLLVLAALDLLRHHTVDVPVARGYLVDGRPPHVTAVLTEKGNGTRWAVDSWTRAYGQPPEILPLARWKTLD